MSSSDIKNYRFEKNNRGKYRKWGGGKDFFHYVKLVMAKPELDELIHSIKFKTERESDGDLIALKCERALVISKFFPWWNIKAGEIDHIDRYDDGNSIEFIYMKEKSMLITVFIRTYGPAFDLSEFSQND